MNPERPMPVAAYNVHGLSTAFLKKQPVFREIAPEFVEFVRGARIVAHNASFDAGFINHELFLAGYDNLETLGCTVFDTLRWARSLFQGYPNGSTTSAAVSASSAKTARSTGRSPTRNFSALSAGDSRPMKKRGS